MIRLGFILKTVAGKLKLHLFTLDGFWQGGVGEDSAFFEGPVTGSFLMFQ